jgi:hypothetical protein
MEPFKIYTGISAPDRSVMLFAILKIFYNGFSLMMRSQEGLIL